MSGISNDGYDSDESMPEAKQLSHAARHLPSPGQVQSGRKACVFFIGVYGVCIKESRPCL